MKRVLELADLPVEKSPSGLPIQHLITESTGSSSIYLGQQWLEPGQRVLDHTHPVEEGLFFVSGSGILKLDHTARAIGPGSSIHIPAGVVHGFQNTGNDTLHVLIVFPVPYFAETTIVEENPAIDAPGRE